MGHARALLTLAPELAAKLAGEAAKEGWSVREVERRAQAFAAGKVPDARAAKKPLPVNDADVAALERELGDTVGARVQIQQGRKGTGKLVIHYGSHDALDGLLERLRK